MFLENAQFGGYKLKSMIGKGGVAEVWLADQLALDREVAVKVISSELVNGEDADFVDRFKREAHAVGRLDHPGILPVFDYGESGGYLYLVMPYARGGNLRSRVRRNPPNKEEIAAIFENITGGIGHAHSHGLIHRDLKPANILLNEEGRAYIGDFGIAKTMDNNTNLTQAGIILGSPSYMAPEQFLGQADKRSDLYSMGLILFFMLTGRKLYNGRLPFEIGKRHLEEPIPLPDPQVPTEYEPFLYKVLAKNPDERYQSAAEMLQAFKEIGRGAPPTRQGSFNAGPNPVVNRPTPARPTPTPNAQDEESWQQEKDNTAANPNDPAARWIQEKRGSGQPAGPEAQWMQEKRGGSGAAPPASQEALWMREKGGMPAQNTPDEAIFNSFSEIKAPPPPPAPLPNQNQGRIPGPPGSAPGEARWMQEKRGEAQPSPEGTLWREFDPSLNSFGELKNPADQTKAAPEPAQWIQEKQGNAGPKLPPNQPAQWMQEKGAVPPRNQPQQYNNPAPGPDQARWMQEKQGAALPPNPNPVRPDPAYERFSREKISGAQPGRINTPAPGQRAPNTAPGEQERWMQEKRGGAAGPNPAQQAQWMQEKSAVPGQAVQQAQWRREKEGLVVPPPGQGNFGPPGYNPNQHPNPAGGPNQPQVTKARRKQPIWLFVVIGVLAVGIIAAVAVLVVGNLGKGTTTPTAQARVTTSATTGTGTTAATTGGTQTTPAVSSSATTGPATTVAVTTAPPTTANGNGQNTVQPSVGVGAGAVSLSGLAGPVNMVSWNSSGQLFLTASDDKTIKAWDAASNKVVKTLDDKAKPVSDRVISAVFSKDGQFVVATLADKTVNVYSYNNGKVVAQVKGDLAVPAAISSDQTLVAYAGARTIHTFDLKKNAAGPEFPYFDPSVKDLAPVALAFSPDNSTLAVGLNNGRIILFASATGKPVMELEPPPDTKSGVKQLAWYGSGASHLAVGRENAVETLVVDLSKKVATNGLAGQSLAAPASNLSVSADSKRLAVSTQKGDLQLWSLENNTILTRSTIGNNPVIGLHWSQDDQKITIATGGSSPALNTVAAQ